MNRKAAREMPFLEHLEELRIRLIRSTLAVILLSIVAFIFSDKLIDLLSSPLPKVYFMAPTEALMVQIKVAMVVGLICAAPYILYQMWMFILPGLYQKEVRIVLPIVLASTLFFYLGGAFCLFIVIPPAIKFLSSFGGERLEPLISIQAYYSFVSQLTLGFAVVFELPVICYFLGRVGILSHKFLVKWRRYAIVIILIVAAVLTPGPDFVSQLTMAIPLYILYELSILIVYLTGRRRKESDSDQPADASANDDKAHAG